MTDNGNRLVELIAGMEEEEAVALADKMIADGVDPFEILAHCRAAMEIVGKKFEQGEYFVPELILSGEMLEAIGAKVKPVIAGRSDAPIETKGTIVLGTVFGDLHDIGKNIVTFMLEVNGYKVVDLGIDVPVDRFLEAIKAEQPQVVALSGFLTLAYDAMKVVIEAIEEAGLRDGRKIMIGGGQIDETVRTETGADAFGMNAMDAVNLCQEWIAA
jgi:5-methyltetrahydrofolate--homocysteine methyltransferase